MQTNYGNSDQDVGDYEDVFSSRVGNKVVTFWSSLSQTNNVIGVPQFKKYELFHKKWEASPE
jgi:hypothetical protein